MNEEVLTGDNDKAARSTNQAPLGPVQYMPSDLIQSINEYNIPMVIEIAQFTG